MRVIAALQADLEETMLGTRSRLADELAGETVLRRTVLRISRARRIDGVFVLCPKGQIDRCRKLLEGTDSRVIAFDAPPTPWAKLVRTGRKWSLDGWRGGIGGTTCFDEFFDGVVICGLLGVEEADFVLVIPAAAPLIDPQLADAMIQHLEALDNESRIVLTQAPPGLCGVLLRASLIHELAEKSTPLGWVLNYKPDAPVKDLIFESCCYPAPAAVRHASGRMIADTDRSFETINSLIRELEKPDAETVGRWLIDRERDRVEPLPREIEIELTTDDPYPEAVLRPRGARVESRGPIDVELVGRIAEEVGRYDDALVVLGGFGDPLRHPRFGEVLSALRPTDSQGSGVYGVAVRTSAIDLNDEMIDALITHRVDVLNVLLDAWTAELYGQLQSPADPDRARLNDVLERIDRVAARCHEAQSPLPIVLPEMTKARQNVHEQDDFFDGWTRRLGAVCVRGYSHYAGQLEDHGVVNMAPSGRTGCRRVRSRCMVLADGRMTICDQDFSGSRAVGSLHEATLGDLWRGAGLESLRKAHAEGCFNANPLCADCEEWHRP